MKPLWNRFEAWWQNNDPQKCDKLLIGAKEEEIIQFENQVGVKLPDDFKRSLSIHNGAKSVNGMIGNWDLMEIKWMAKECKIMADMLDNDSFGKEACGDEHPRIKTTWWNKLWIPFVSSGSGHFFCIDLDPLYSSNWGQVFLWLHDDSKRFLLGCSFKEWFERVVIDLEKGIYTYDVKEECFIGGGEAFMKSALEGQNIYG